MPGRIWSDAISTEDQAVFDESGLGRSGGLGRSPALLVVDVTHDFTGDKPERTRESIKRFPLSCGEPAWRARPKLRELIEARVPGEQGGRGVHPREGDELDPRGRDVDVRSLVGTQVAHGRGRGIADGGQDDD